MPAGNRIHLVRLPGLLLMLVVVVLVLLYLFPRQQGIEQAVKQAGTDSLSLSYLRALLRSQPDDTRVRLLLARRLLAAGRLEEAQQVLAGLSREKAGKEQKAAGRLLMNEIRLRRLQNEQDLALLRSVQEALLDDLRSLPVSSISAEDMERLVQQVAALGDPAFAARVCRLLARRDRHKPARWWAEAGRYALAANDPGAASRDYFRAAQAARGQQARHLAEKSIDAALAAAHPDDAFALARYFLNRWPDDDRLLRKGSRVALATSHHAEAMQWNDRYLEHHPRDLDALRRGRDVALALGRLDRARALGLRILRLSGHTTEDRERLARIMEWGGDPVAALAQWRLLARTHDRAAYDREILRLARMVLDLPEEKAALERLARKRQLERSEVLRLAEVEEALGDPEAADRVLAAWLKRHPRDRKLHAYRYRLALRSGRPGHALEIVDAMEQRFGSGDELRRMRARAQWLALDEEGAWHTLEALENPLQASDPYDLELHAELAWRHDRPQLALSLYRTLLEHYRDRVMGPSEEDDGTAERVRLVHERLILLAARQGDPDLVAEAGIHGWKQLHDEALLRLALMRLASAGAWPQLEQLLAVTRREGLNPQGMGRVLMQAADRSWQARHINAAEHLYRRALEINPGLDEARIALLWLWIDAQRREPLRSRLNAWSARARTDERYWAAYAAGWEALGEPGRAIPWYLRHLERHPRDVLWRLNLADALDAEGRRADAWQVRRNTLRSASAHLPARMRVVPRATEQDREILLALGRQNGRQAIDPVIETMGAQGRLETPFLTEWALGGGEDARARHWLRQRHYSRMQLPAWQRLELALNANDLSRIEQQLSGEGLSPLSRVRGEARQGREALALTRVLPLARTEASHDERWAATQWAAELYRRLPTTWDVAGGQDSIGALDVDTLEAGGRMSRGNLSWDVRVSRDLLDMTDGSYDLAGRDREQRLRAGVEWFRLRDTISMQAGLASRTDRDLPYLRLEWRHRLSAHHDLSLWGERNGISNATRIVRADTAIDRLHLDWSWSMTARSFLQLDLEANALHSRAGEAVARGQLLELSVGDRQMLGTNELQLRLQGAWLRNHLSDQVPADMQPRMEPGSTIEDIITDRYAALGIGLAIARGQPMARAPVVGGLRYRGDVWAGWTWPEGRPSVSGELAVGSRVLGSDELALVLHYSETLNLRAGEANVGWRLQYRYFLGR